ncbi:MAG: hypothetical protein J6X92_05075 [Bacteroidales bacterium]|nr:hypothetical protein [Bacteroidales bacterium]
MRTWILMLMGLLLTTNIFAQTGQTVYFMDLQQARELNPAFSPSKKVYIGLPILTGVNVGVVNNFVQFNDIFYKTPDGEVSTIFDSESRMSAFLSKVRPGNFVDTHFSTQLLGIGFPGGEKNTFSIELNLKAKAATTLPGDFLKVALKGNDSFVGSKIDMSKLDADAVGYAELAFGISREVNSRFKYGIRPKLVLGIASVSTNVKNLEVAISNDYTHDLNVDMETRVSGPVEVTLDDEGKVDEIKTKDVDINSFSDAMDYLFKKPNLGVGIDFGFEYLLAPQLRLSAAVNDIGLIRWNNEVSEVSAQGRFSYRGLDLGEIARGDASFDEAMDELVDSLKNCTQFTSTTNSFFTMLPTSVNVGLGLDLSSWFTLGALSQTRFYGGKIRESVTLSGNANLKLISATVAYTITENNYCNIGGGIAFNLGIGKLYVIADNIPIYSNKISLNEGDTQFLLPTKWNLMHIRAGLNLTFGRREGAGIGRFISKSHNTSPRTEESLLQ